MMGYKITSTGKVKRTHFPKRLTDGQIKQLEHAKSNETAVAKSLESNFKRELPRTVGGCLTLSSMLSRTTATTFYLFPLFNNFIIAM